MRYEDLMRDARNEILMDSSRLHAALDAIYTCCTPAGSLEESLKAIDMSPSDTALVSRLAAWVLNVAPLGPLPMSPDEAIALAERVHKNMGAR